MADKRIFQLDDEGFLDDLTDKVYMWLDKKANDGELQEPSWKFKANVFLKILNNFATKFVPNVATVEGKCYWHDGELFVCDTAYTGDWVPGNFTATSIDELFARKDVLSELQTNVTTLTTYAQNVAASIAPPFDPTKPNDGGGYAYYAGTPVMYEGSCYVFTSNKKSGNWDPIIVEKKPLSESIQLEGVGEAVNEWLNEHPEATTTVQDNSITDEKLAPLVKTQWIAAEGKLGKKVLDPNQSFVSQLVNTDTIYVIRDPFDLGGQIVAIPDGIIFEFDGGSLFNGILTGIFNVVGLLDLRNFGIVYGADVAYSVGGRNFERLNIMQGVTNHLSVQISDDVVLIPASQYASATINDVEFFGNDHTIYFGIRSITVRKNLGCHDIHFMKYSQSTYASLFNLEDVTENLLSNVVFDGCTFEGDMRVFTSNRYASSEYNKGINNFIVKNCTGHNLAKTAGGANTIIFLQNTYYRQVRLENVKIFNMACIFLDAGTTNGSEYDLIIKNRYNERSFVMTDCLFQNSRSFKMSSVLGSTRTDIRCASIEHGQAVVTGCKFIDIVNDVGGSTYDAYLSCQDVVYSSNVWRNVLDITETTSNGYNCLMKSKKGSDDASIRVYRDNLYITDSFIVPESGVVYLRLFGDNANQARGSSIVDSNSFYLEYLYLNHNGALSGDIKVFSNNKFIINKAICYQYSGLFYPKGGVTYVKDNLIEISEETNTEGLSAFSVAYNTEAGELRATGNVFKGPFGRILNFGQSSSIAPVEITDNNFTVTGTPAGSNKCIISRPSASMVFKDNIVNDLSSASITYANGNFGFPISFTCNKRSLSFYAPSLENGEQALVTITMKASNGEGTTELLFKKDSVGDTSVVGFDSNNGVLENSTTSYQTYKGITGTSNVSCNRTNINLSPIVTLNDVISVTIAVRLKGKLSYPSSGSTAARATYTGVPVGFVYFDTDLGKSVTYTGSAWVNMDGTPIT